MTETAAAASVTACGDGSDDGDPILDGDNVATPSIAATTTDTAGSKQNKLNRAQKRQHKRVVEKRNKECDNLTVVIRFFPELLSFPQFPPLRTTDVRV